jgi:hypothetical protein
MPEHSRIHPGIIPREHAGEEGFLKKKKAMIYDYLAENGNYIEHIIFFQNFDRDQKRRIYI